MEDKKEKPDQEQTSQEQPDQKQPDQEQPKQEQTDPVDYKKMYSDLKEEHLALSGDYNTLVTDYKDALVEIKELKEAITRLGEDLETKTSAAGDFKLKEKFKAANNKVRKLQDELRNTKKLVPPNKIRRHV